MSDEQKSVSPEELIRQAEGHQKKTNAESIIKATEYYKKAYNTPNLSSEVKKVVKEALEQLYKEVNDKFKEKGIYHKKAFEFFSLFVDMADIGGYLDAKFMTGQHYEKEAGEQYESEVFRKAVKYYFEAGKAGYVKAAERFAMLLVRSPKAEIPEDKRNNRLCLKLAITRGNLESDFYKKALVLYFNYVLDARKKNVTGDIILDGELLEACKLIFDSETEVMLQEHQEALAKAKETSKEAYRTFLDKTKLSISSENNSTPPDPAKILSTFELFINKLHGTDSVKVAYDLVCLADSTEGSRIFGAVLDETKRLDYLQRAMTYNYAPAFTKLAERQMLMAAKNYVFALKLGDKNAMPPLKALEAGFEKEGVPQKLAAFYEIIKRNGDEEIYKEFKVDEKLVEWQEKCKKNESSNSSSSSSVFASASSPTLLPPPKQVVPTTTNPLPQPQTPVGSPTMRMNPPTGQ